MHSAVAAMTVEVIRTPHGDMATYVAVPAGAGPWLLHGRGLRGGAGPGHGYAAASVNYGGCPKNAQQALAGACPIVGSYGGKDRSPMGRTAAPRLDQALTALGSTMMSRCIPARVTDSSTTPTPADATPLLVFLAKISGTRYHEPPTRTRAAASPPSSPST